jgi:small subunit ribosomal protein S20
MANHKSALKRIRQANTRKERNKYQLKTTRTYIKRLRDMKDKGEAEKLFYEVTAMIDKLAKKNIIHKNTASNKKSSLARHVNSL